MSEFIKVTCVEDIQLILPKSRIEYIKELEDFRFIALRRSIFGNPLGAIVKETLDELMEMLESKAI